MALISPIQAPAPPSAGETFVQVFGVHTATFSQGYFSLSMQQSAALINASLVQFFVPFDIVITSVHAYLSNNTGNDSTFSLVVDEVTTPTSFTILSQTRTGELTNLTLPISAGSRMCWFFTAGNMAGHSKSLTMYYHKNE